MAMEFTHSVGLILLIIPVLILIAILLFIAKIFCGSSITDPRYPPVIGTVFHMLLYFNTMYDHQTEVARTCHTYRLLAPGKSAIYTTDVRNVEHVLKTKFEKYSKGKQHVDILTDLFREGIYLVDGDKWRHQRKLASFEFSTRVLRDCSSKVFRKCSGKLCQVLLNPTKPSIFR